MRPAPLLLLTGNSAAARLNLAPQTLKRRLIEKQIEPDAIIQNGSRPPTIAFNVESLPRLRSILCTPKIVC